MNEQEFANDMANVITKYIQGHFAYDADEEISEKAAKKSKEGRFLDRLRGFKSRKDYGDGISEIIQNPIFEMKEEELIYNGENVYFCKSLYEDISKVYIQLKVLSGLEL